MPIELPVADEFNSVGIDLGLWCVVAIPTGKTVPQHLANAGKPLRRTRRAVARARRNSNRQRKIRLDVARSHARLANR
jgi:putative transposase